MSQTADQVTECPFPMQKSQRQKIEKKAEEMGISDTHIFTVVLEEGLEVLD